uniref:Putative secreted protein n=1 Tax=Anopheles darlingi TaxID=43151 RepID=A0A2M4DE10_ANODA
MIHARACRMLIAFRMCVRAACLAPFTFPARAQSPITMVAAADCRSRSVVARRWSLPFHPMRRSRGCDFRVDPSPRQTVPVPSYPSPFDSGANSKRPNASYRTLPGSQRYHPDRAQGLAFCSRSYCPIPADRDHCHPRRTPGHCPSRLDSAMLRRLRESLSYHAVPGWGSVCVRADRYRDLAGSNHPFPRSTLHRTWSEPG